MECPLEIVFRNITDSRALESFINQESERLEKFFHRIISSRIMVEKLQKAALPSGLYKIRIDINIPKRHAIIIKKEAKIIASYEKLCILIKAAFKAAIRELEKIKERELAAVKGRRRTKIII